MSEYRTITEQISIPRILTQTGYFCWSNRQPLLILLIPFALLGLIGNLLFWYPIEQQWAEQETAGSLVWITSAASRYLIYIFLLGVLLQINGVYLLSCLHQGIFWSWRTLANWMIRFFPIVALGNVLISMLSFVGLLFFILPGLYCYIRFSLFDFSVLLEQRSLLAALNQSLRYTRTIVWQIIGILILTFSLFCLLNISLSILLRGLSLPSLLIHLSEEIIALAGSIFWLVMRYRCFLLLREKQEISSSANA